jgi:hypothetical protein
MVFLGILIGLLLLIGFGAKPQVEDCIRQTQTTKYEKTFSLSESITVGFLLSDSDV